MLEEWVGKRSCHKQDFLSFVGKLAHSDIVSVGEIFLSFTMEAKEDDHWIHFSVEFLVNVAWWQAFLCTWNHHSMMHLFIPDMLLEITFMSDTVWGEGQPGTFTGCSRHAIIYGTPSRLQ